MSEYTFPEGAVLVPVDQIPQVENNLSAQEQNLLAALNRNNYDYREVRCPKCGAMAGAYCLRPSGHAGPFMQPHGDRKQKAQELWRQEEEKLYGQVVSHWLMANRVAPKPALIPHVEVGGQFSLF